MTLRELLATAGITGGDESVVRGITSNAEHAGPGIVFVAVDTPLARGHARVRQAIKRGALALIVEHAVAVPPETACPILVVQDSKRVLAQLAAALFGDAHRRLRLWATTGTKGKSTVCHLLHAMRSAAGSACGLIATKHQRIGTGERASAYTTPEAPELHAALRDMVIDGATDAVIEASSIGLAFDRLHGLEFEGAVFTNLGRDHLQTHGGLAGLEAAKARLFTQLSRLAIVNSDDRFGAELATRAAGRVVTYGLESGDLRFSELALRPSGLTGTIAGMHVESRLLGRHNAYNVLAAAALGLAANWPATAIADGIAGIAGLPGRMEQIADPSDSIAAYVDYAHTPESVAAALDTLREIHRDRRIVVVVGCSGGTDPSKRPQIAHEAVTRADRCIFTADNPRLEDPGEIANQMIAGVRDRLPERWEVELDRRHAIELGIELAWPDGVLAVLGKGDETTQEVGWERRPFDDRAVVRDALAARRTDHS